MHGGDIYRNKIEYDFSVNVNPFGVPESVQRRLLESIPKLTQYPDLESQALREALASHFKVSENQIVCGNGASELIHAILRALQVKKAFLLAPSFQGYETALDMVGAERSYYYLSKENDFQVGETELEQLLNQMKLEQPDLCIVTNPNNPNGAMFSLEQLMRLAECCSRMGTWLLVDECFVELTTKADSQSILSLYSKQNQAFSLEALNYTIVLRAFTKSFAIPGLRLGYCVAVEKTIPEQIKGQLPEWNVSIPAQEAGQAALEEADYLNKSRAYIAKEREFLSEELGKLGFHVYPSEANYLLFQMDQRNLNKTSPSKNLIDLKQELMEKQILIRDCSDYKGLGQGFYRIAVRKHEENVILLERMKACLK